MNQSTVNGFRLSPQQLRLWQLARRHEDAWMFQQFLVRITRPLPEPELRARIVAVMQQHEILRTSFPVLPGMTLPVQAIAGPVVDSLESVDLTTTSRELQVRTIEEAWQALAAGDNPETLLRLQLFRCSEQKHVLLVRCSCLVLDGTALSLFLQKILTSPPIDATEDVIQFADVAEWLHETANEPNDVARDYWREVTAAPAAADWLPREAKPLPVGRGVVEVRREIPAPLYARLCDVAQTHGLSLRAIVLAAWLVALRRVGEPRHALRYVAEGRHHEELAGLLGPLERALPLCASVHEEHSFIELCRDLETKMVEAEAFGDYYREQAPAEQDETAVPPCGFEYRRLAPSAPDVTIERQVSGFELFRLHLSALQEGDHMRLSFSGNAQPLSAEFMALIAERHASTLEAAGQHPGAAVRTFARYSEGERDALLRGWQGPRAAIPPGATLCSLFQRAAHDHAARPAVADAGGVRSYGQLDRDSNRLARLLQVEAGAGHGELIGLRVRRSYELIVAMLAVLKIGGIYAPIDPAAPTRRQRQVLDDMAAHIVLADTPPDEALNGTATWIMVNDPRIETQSGSEVNCAVMPDDLAYCIYTSGSTGVPKGVLVAHRNVVNLWLNHRRLYAEGPDDRVSQVANMSFDSSCAEIWPTLLGGATLHIVAEDIRLDYRAMYTWLSETRITITFQPTAVAERLVAEPWPASTALRALRTGGDKLKTPPAATLPFRFFNEYGPTEATVWVTCAEVPGGGAYLPGNIGSPGLNEQTYILDDQLRLQPTGVFGELCMAGAGVAAGYLNRPESTDRKFPMVALESEPLRIYRTGDIGRWSPRGTLEFRGRVDGQIKIRGHRVELGEIEAAVLRHAQVTAAVVLALDEDGIGGGGLVGFYVARGTLAPETALEFLASVLPSYMVPSRMWSLEELPLTTRGKVDREALAKLTRTEATAECSPPQTETETKLAAIWCQLLRRERVGRSDSFFKLGGHSLRAMDLLSRISKELRADVSLREIFDHAVLSDLASLVDHKVGGAYVPLSTRSDRALFPATSQQQRILAIQHLDPTTVAYNVTQAFRLEGVLDADAAVRTFAALTRRHDALRTRFVTQNGRFVQIVEPEVKPDLQVLALTADKAAEFANTWKAPHDVTKAPLCRARLIRLTDRETQHVLLLDLHHAIVDGVSIGILIRDFVALYAGKELSPIRASYGNYALWQQQWLNSEMVVPHRNYWLQLFGEGAPALNLPTDFNRPALRGKAGAHWKFALPAEVTRLVDARCAETDTTRFMFLLAVFDVLLGKISGDDDIVVGTATAGRDHADVGEVVGMFANTVPIRVRLPVDRSFRSVLDDVKLASLDAFSHQQYPYEDVVRALPLRRDLSRHPLFDVMFMYQGGLSNVTDSLALKVEPFAFVRTTAKFDLTLMMWEHEGALVGDLEYATDLFRAESMSRFADRFRRVLEQALENLSVLLRHVDVLLDDEMKRLVGDAVPDTSATLENETVLNRVESHARHAGSRIAIIDDAVEITYAELDEHSRRIAGVLLSHGLTDGATVGLLLPRSVDAIAAMLGVMHAGGAFLPIEPATPIERIGHMLQESDATMLLTAGESLAGLEFSGRVIDVTHRSAPAQSLPLARRGPTPEHTAYVMFTSGSTGRPKCCPISHAALLNYADWALREYCDEQTQVFALYTSLSFDLTFTSIFVPLIGGKAIKVFRQTDPLATFQALLADKTVDFLKATPAHLEAMRRLDCSRSQVRKLVIGGEELRTDLVAAMRECFPLPLDIYNEYGPTEATIGCMIYKCDAARDLGATVSIGRPAPRVRVYILNRDRQLAAIGSPGELCVSGVQVTRGYKNQPGLNAEKFVDHPHRAGERLYRTGDLARWSGNGAVEYLGRIDRQVKINGYRIEPAEIEAELIRTPGITSSIVVAQSIGARTRLVAYFVGARALNIEWLRQSLAARLPQHLIPAQFVRVEAIPLDGNGKIDRRLLPPVPEENVETTPFVAPGTDLEEQICAIWRSVLRRDRVGLDDNFFDLGGTSLSLIEAQAKLQEQLQRDVTLLAMFECPTIRSLIDEHLSPAVSIEEASRRPVPQPQNAAVAEIP